MKRDKKKTLKRLCDRLWQLAGKKKHEDILFSGKVLCWGCNKLFNEEEICGHHFVPKSLSLALRYDLKNFIPIHCGCHMAVEFRKDPFVTMNIEKHLGKKTIEYLNKTRRNEIRESVGYYEEMIKKLKSNL